MCKPLAFADEEYRSFSLVTVGAVMHHFPDVGLAASWLVWPEGVLHAEDVFDAGNKCHDADTPRGFAVDELGSVLSAAGVLDFGFEVLLISSK